MSRPPEAPPGLSPLKQALLALEEMQAKLDAAERAKSEPLAIVGMGCRFPGGASDPEAFWKLLSEGADVVGDIPIDRWDPEAYYDPDPDAPGKMSTRQGAFLDDVYGFDPQFFGIAPREATSMDPQQRLLLEVTWEALEDAGLAPDRLSGSRTGVFIGICRGDYSQLQTMGGDPSRFDLYYASGQAHSIAAGRLSYVLGLQGPSVALDTACSSSLVALHLACQSLRLGESNMAVVGGANLILSPENAITFSKGRMLAADGRCKTFDARADGFVEGEGVAVVVLKRLSDAQAAGDRILALIRGTAVNQDGPSSGLTAPNGPAQQAVIREALASGGVEPRDVSYVEAHGTGTSLGDPIEVQAIAAVLGQGRPADDPVLIGSVKTNVGHLESSAGVAGLLKVVLALQHREIPPHIHFQEPNPLIPWAELPVAVPTRRTAWEPARGTRIAGLSSFGFSGTNAHVVIQEAPAMAPVGGGGVDRPWHLLALSARNEAALRELAARHLARLGSGASLADVCFTANAGRAHLSHRVALTAATLDDLRGKLAAVRDGHTPAGVARSAEPAAGPSKVAFLFTGQGSQYVGMGRELFETQPTFRKALERCDEVLRGVLERPLLSVLYPGEGETSPLDDTAYTQPALFAVEYALSELWRSFGIEPLAVMGHSVGEYVAACVAGVFSLDDGLKLIAERGRLMQALPRNGDMAAVFADEDRVKAAIANDAGLSIAAVNGPDNVVVSGERKALDAVLARLASEGVKAKKLTVSHAFHSPLMEPMLADFEKVAEQVSYRPPRIALVSNVTGRLARPGEMEHAAYWVRHVRAAVRFDAGMQALSARGCQVLVEVGPSPILLGMGRRCLTDEGRAWLPSLRPGRDDWSQMLESLAALYVRGGAIDWSGYDRDYPRRRVALPTYPFQRKFYRFEAAGSRGAKPAMAQSEGHPLLGRRIRSPLLKETLYETTVTRGSPDFVQDHQVYGNVVMPGAAFLEMLGAAGADSFGEPCSAEDVVIQEALVLEEGETRTLQVLITPDGEEASAQVVSMPTSDGADHVVHVVGRIRRGAIRAPAVSLETAQRRCVESVPVPTYYEGLEERGILLGARFRGIEELWRAPGESLGRLRLPASQEGEQGYRIHPVLLDACLQIIAAALRDGGETTEDVYMPLGLEAFHLDGPAPSLLWSHATIRDGGKGGETLAVDLRVFHDDGRLLATIDGLQLKRVDPEALRRGAKPSFDDWLYRVEWPERPRLGLAGSPPEYIPAPLEIAAAVQPHVVTLSAEHGLPAYDRLLPRLDALSAAYVVEAFRALGWEMRPGDRTSAAELTQRLHIVPAHGRLLGRLLEMLEEDGLVERRESGWTVLRVPPAEPAEGIWRGLRAEFPSGAAELALTGRCGERLADVLRGACDPLELLFPGGSLESAEKLYQESPPSRVFQALAQQVVKAALASLPAGRSVRILEIGAGTGGTTSYVVPSLPADRTEYVFTDVSPLFTAKAETKFRDFPFVRYQVLDIEQDPEPQGFSPHRFDVILAANVLHATKDLRQTVAHATRLLAPGGLLVVSEIVARQRWIDLTFGLLDGWWRFADIDLRPSYPLLTRDGWLGLLAGAGCVASATVPSVPEGTGILSQNVLVIARASDSSSPVPATAPGRFLVVADSEGTGERLAARLESRGQTVALVHDGAGYERSGNGNFRVDLKVPANHARFVREWLADEGAPPRGVVHLWAPEGSGSAEGPAPLLPSGAERGSCGSILSLVQALGAVRGSAPPRLWLVTRGAQPVEGPMSLALPESPVWGMAKVVALEHPELHCTRIDLPPVPDSDDVEGLLEELLAGDGEDQVAYRRGTRRVARLARLPSGAAEPAFQRLQITRPGVLDALELRPFVPRPPEAGEVEIRVRAAGLNFRDVLNALGMRTDEDPLGGECAGTIVAVGAGVTDLKVGDDVIAVAAGSFADSLTTGCALVVPKPKRLSFEEAATLPLAFLTADYALHHTARMKTGDRVLIHAAAGGVGMAALQLAQRAGAEVFATAGSREKREYLSSLGVPHVMDSRSLAFADEVMERTGGRGVDVILNPLAGDFIPKGLSALAPGGRFLEIGKAGIWDAPRVAAVRPDVAYFVVDLALTLHETPAAVRPLLLAIMTAVEEGRLSPLPRQTFGLAEAPQAFRHMAQARHIGKVILTPAGGEAQGTLPVRFRADGTYLITGGLGGLGLAVARWMAERGAGVLLLMGRRPPSAAASEILRAIEGLGARIEVIQGDVSLEADVARALAGDGTRPPLRGVFHSAGVLADGVLLQQDWDRFSLPLAPKVAGSFNLHRLTAKDPLDFFVLFSSLSSLLGSAGQSNHAAANAFLDALAHHRRGQGQPASSINWGAWSEVGAAAERDVGRRITAQGLRTFNPRQGLQVLERLLRENPVQVGVVPVEWGRFLKGSAAGATRFYTELAKEVRQVPRATRVDPGERVGLKERIEASAPNQRYKLVVGHVLEQVTKVLALEAGQPIDHRQALNEMGLDSLMAVELRNLLAAGLGLRRSLPATLVFDHPSVSALADYLAREVFGLEAASGGKGDAQDTEVNALDRIEELSDEEVERLLNSKGVEGPGSASPEAVPVGSHGSKRSPS